MYVICGLGNPGKEYEATRHNMGFLTMDVLSERLGIQIKKLKFKALYGEGTVNGEKVMLVKPQTFMNNSGDALREIMTFYKVPAENIMVVYDDIDLPCGSVRVRPFGGSGTHNGMRSVVYQLQTDRFPRVRVGVGSNGQIPLMSFVIGKWTEEERPLIADAVLKAADACELWLNKGIQECMNKINTKDAPKKKKEENKDQQP